jgi:hypothetical protein
MLKFSPTWFSLEDPSHETIDSLEELTTILVQGKDIALETCTTVPTHMGSALQPGLRCRPRKAKATRRHAKDTRKHLGEWKAATDEVAEQAVTNSHTHLQDLLCKIAEQRCSVNVQTITNLSKHSTPKLIHTQRPRNTCTTPLPTLTKSTQRIGATHRLKGPGSSCKSLLTKNKNLATR